MENNKEFTKPVLKLHRSDRNEIRVKIEGGKFTEAVLYYKDKEGLEAGKEELKRRGFC